MPEYVWVAPAVDENMAREKAHKGETFRCKRCGKPGVVGDDLSAGCSITGTQATRYWMHNKCFAEETAAYPSVG